MPVVPFSGPTSPGATKRQPPPAEPFALMAAAQMHAEGRLVEGGSYIGELTGGDLSFDRTEPLGRRDGDKIERSTSPEDIMRKAAPDEEGYTLPDNPHLFIRKKKPGKGDEEALVS